MHTISLNCRTSSGSPPPPLVLNASSFVPGPLANTEASTAAGLVSHALPGCPVPTVVWSWLLMPCSACWPPLVVKTMEI